MAGVALDRNSFEAYIELARKSPDTPYAYSLIGHELYNLGVLSSNDRSRGRGTRQDVAIKEVLITHYISI